MLPRSISGRDEASVSHCCPKGTGAQGLSGRRGTLCSVASVNGALLAELTGGGSIIYGRPQRSSGLFNIELSTACLQLTVAVQREVIVDRNPNASLSPREVNTLRALKRDLRRAVSGEDRKLLLAMGLAVEDGERIALSPAGRARLDREDRAPSGKTITAAKP